MIIFIWISYYYHGSFLIPLFHLHYYLAFYWKIELSIHLHLFIYISRDSGLLFIPSIAIVIYLMLKLSHIWVVELLKAGSYVLLTWVMIVKALLSFWYKIFLLNLYFLSLSEIILSWWLWNQPLFLESLVSFSGSWCSAVRCSPPIRLVTGIMNDFFWGGIWRATVSTIYSTIQYSVPLCVLWFFLCGEYYFERLPLHFVLSYIFFIYFFHPFCVLSF